MDPIQTSQVIVTVAFLFAFVSTLQFYRSRISITPVEQKGALAPTLIISLAFLVGSVTAFLSFYSLTTLPGLPATFSSPPDIELVYPWELISELVSPLFGFALLVAVVTALRRRNLYTIPVALLIASWVLVLLSPKHPLDTPYLPLYLAASSLMLVIPMLLFGFLWRKTRRPTAFGMFVGLLLYYLYFLFNQVTVSQFIGSMGFYFEGEAKYLGHVAMYETLVNFEVLAVFDAVASLFFVYWCFRYSDRKLGGEVIGYSLTVPAIASEAFILLTTVGAVPFEYFLVLTMMMVGAGIFILTGSYLYGRFRESHVRQTLMLSMFSVFVGFSYFAANIGQNIYILAGRPNMSALNPITFTLGLITSGFLFLAAVYAIERPSLVFLPPAVIIPLVILALIFNPLPTWLSITMAVVALLMTIVPGGLFAVLWRRMSKEKEKGRGRIMGVFFGFLFLLLSSPVLIGTSIVADQVAYMSSIVGIAGSMVVLLGSLLFFLGVSGRFDKWIYDRRK